MPPPLIILKPKLVLLDFFFLEADLKRKYQNKIELSGRRSFSAIWVAHFHHIFATFPTNFKSFNFLCCKWHAQISFWCSGTWNHQKQCQMKDLDVMRQNQFWQVYWVKNWEKMRQIIPCFVFWVTGLKLTSFPIR